LDRFVCDLDVELDTGRARVFGRGIDLADGALSCTAKAPIDPGTTVQIQLRLVLEWGSSETVAVSGHVLWMTETEGAYQLGVMLTELTGDARQRLAVLVKVLTGAISLPPPGR
jgi:hypothetical protein